MEKHPAVAILCVMAFTILRFLVMNHAVSISPFAQARKLPLGGRSRQSLYNQLVFETDETQASRRGERLFDLIIPVGWNDALPDARGGSAIFIHAARPDFSGTSGCVVVAHEHLTELARRVRPGMVIDIASVDGARK